MPKSSVRGTSLLRITGKRMRRGGESGNGPSKRVQPRLPSLFHPHRCVFCQRVHMVACPDARARSCAIICRLCAAIVSEGFEAHRLEKGVTH